MPGASGGTLEIFILTDSKGLRIASATCSILGINSEHLSIVNHILFTKDENDIHELLDASGIHRATPHEIQRYRERNADSGPCAAFDGDNIVLSESTDTSNANALMSIQGQVEDLFGSQGYINSRAKEVATFKISMEELGHLDTMASQADLPSFAVHMNSVMPAIQIPHREESIPISITTKNAKDVQMLSDVDIVGVAQNVRQPSMQSDATERGTRIRFLGEYYVYQLLKRTLPAGTFGPTNWTSALRGQVPDFPPFTQEAVANFEYVDTDGVFTTAFFPLDHPLRGARPKYFIEVKSTSGAQSSTFRLPRRQFLHALSMTRHGQNAEGHPDMVYLLFRVSNVGGQGKPEVRAYDDLHDLLARGILRVESKSVEVRIVS